MGGSWTDWALLLSAFIGLVSIFLWLKWLGKSIDNSNSNRELANPNIVNINNDNDDENNNHNDNMNNNHNNNMDNNENNNGNNNNIDNDNNRNMMMNFNMTKKQFHKHQKRRLKDQQKEAFTAYLKMKKEKDDERLRAWREKYGMLDDDDDNKSDSDEIDSDCPNSKNGHFIKKTDSSSSFSSYERFQRRAKEMTEFILAELQKSDLILISELTANLSIETESCILLLQAIEGQDENSKGIFIDNQSKYLCLSDRFTSGLNDLIQQQQIVDGDMLDKYIAQYVKSISDSGSPKTNAAGGFGLWRW